MFTRWVELVTTEEQNKLDYYTGKLAEREIAYKTHSYSRKSRMAFNTSPGRVVTFSFNVPFLSDPGLEYFTILVKKKDLVVARAAIR